MATATAVMDGVSSRAGTGTRRNGHLLPPPRTGEPTATSRVSRGSSSRRSEASEGAARGTDDAEGMGKKMLPEADAMGGREGCYRIRSSSCYGSRAAPLTRDHQASHPVSSRRGGDGCKTRGGSDASSSVRPRPNDKQERMSTRAIFLQQPSVPRNIRPQAARHASLQDRRVEVGNRVPPRFFHKHRGHVRAIDATNEEISPRVSEKENDVDGQKYWQTDSVPSRILSARDWNSESDGAFEGSNHIADFKNPCALPRNIKVQARKLPSVLRRVEEAGLLPPRFIHCGPGRLMCQARSSYNYSQFVGAIDPTNGKFPKATEMENEVDEQDCQTAIVASLSPSAQDLDAESYGVFEATKPDSELKKPSATPRNIRIQRHGQPSVLGRSVEGGNQVPKRLIARSRPDKLIRQACFSHNYSPCVGAIDDIHEQRVPKGCSKQYSSVTTSSKFDGVPLRKCLTTSAKGIQIAGATKKVVYATTLGGGGGYGDPHPHPSTSAKFAARGLPSPGSSAVILWCVTIVAAIAILNMLRTRNCSSRKMGNKVTRISYRKSSLRVQTFSCGNHSRTQQT